MSLIHFFFGFSGRISRQPFWLGLMALMALEVAVMTVLDVTAFEPGKVYRPSTAMTAWDLLTCWPNAAIVIKRFNDRNHSPWFGIVLAALFVVLVLANHIGLLVDPNGMQAPEKLLFAALLLYFIWAIVDAGFLPGTPGDNRYGPDPLGRIIHDGSQT
jgi:uncharacterized membrane protein YhaH (DUF805 family)